MINQRPFRCILLLLGALVLLSAAILAGHPVVARVAPGDAAPGPMRAVAPQQGTPTPTCTPAWQVVPSPNQGAGHNWLVDLAAINADDLWAVGEWRNGFTSQTLTEHWNGSAWTIVPSPNMPQGSTLYGVAGVTADDVWAVGESYSSTVPPRSLAMHWNGSTWTIVPTPNPGPNPNPLRAVIAFASNDVWAAGSWSINFGQTFIVHWDGTAWTQVPTPNAGTRTNELYGISGTAPNNLWAVGHYDMMSSGPSILNTLVLHWDGTAWSVVPSPNMGTGENGFRAVAAVAANDVWAVGHTCPGGTCPSGGEFTLTEHWNGSAWSIVPSPNASGANFLFGVTGTGPADAWAVGLSNPGAGWLTLALHWDGSAWNPVPPVNVGTEGSRLDAVRVVGGAVWAVGNYYSGNIDHTLIERYGPFCGPPATATAGPPSPTGTPTPPLTPTSTPTSTPTITPGGPTLTATPFPSPSRVPTSFPDLIGRVVWNTGCPPPVLDLTTRCTNCVPPRTAGPSTMRLQNSSGASLDFPVPSVGYLNPEYTYSCPLGACLPSGWLASLPFTLTVDIFNAVIEPDESNNTASIGGGPPPCVSVTPTPTLTPTRTPTSGVPPTGSPTRPPSPSPTFTPGCVPDTWNLVPSSNLGSGSNQLLAVAVHAPDDIWAVGWGGGYPLRTLTLHWDGVTWSVVPSPNPGVGQNNTLHGVVALAAADAWAVGAAEYNGSGDLILLHWDGQIWTAVAGPNPGGPTGLYAVSAVSATDIWAVGSTEINNTAVTTALHWDGTQWNLVPSPSPGQINGLYGAAALAANNVWAVGSTGSIGPSQGLIVHWDGTAWTRVPSPSVTNYDVLRAIAVVGPNDIWVVGDADMRPLTLHWDGSAWTVVPAPSAGGGMEFLQGVAAGAGNDVWAVGSSDISPEIQHWDGSTWSLMSGPLAGRINNLFAVAAVRPGDLWTVGYYNLPNNPDRTLTAHYLAGCLSPTPTFPPNPTRTASPTRTTSPTAGTPAPTACAIQFTDVNPNNPFYSFIRCLACRQIISGYADGTFRWQNNITRGQLAKILAGAAGLTTAIPSTQQTFSDVPGSNGFWVFVERLAASGAIAGYTCGGPGEPCDLYNRPYFRWGADATRGQIAKIAALAARYNEPIPTTQQTFEDVPSSNVFWAFIERLAARGIISGYICGGPGEPCDPSNRPYFRWGNATTRGQLAKIAAQTFFPSCATPARR